MTLDDILTAAPVLPVVTIGAAEQAVPLARALLAGGLPALEITLRTPCALEAVRRIRAEVEGCQVGVGTVRSDEDLDRAAQAGARFAVSPGLPPGLGQGPLPLPLLPGVMTPTEAMAAAERGYTRLKLFPAREAGGAALLQALAGPLPELRFCPTGGLGEDDLPRFLALPNLLCIGGSWLAPAAALERGEWAQIEARARRAVAIAAGAPAAPATPGGPSAAGEEDPGAAITEPRP